MMRAPSSKSITHRALICASLAGGRSEIFRPLVCEDTMATLNVLSALGIFVEMHPNSWIVHGGFYKTPAQELFCGESATTHRLMSEILETLKIPCRLTMSTSLQKRPARPAANISSQSLSGLLLAAPLKKMKTTIECPNPVVSKPYVDLTIDVQKKFGVSVSADENFTQFQINPQEYQPTDFEVEGDWSLTANFIAIGALSQKIEISGLDCESLQGDKEILTILKEMGGKISWEGEKLVVNPSALKAIEWDMTHIPDLFPVVAILSACARGKSRLVGIERLQYKESNRPLAIAQLLTAAGVRCVWEKDRFEIEGGEPKGFVVDSDDHRIIMAAAVMSLVAKGETSIKNKEAVKKSLPDFWKIFHEQQPRQTI